MTITALLLGLVTGLALASIYVLIALSFTLVLAASGVFNFAQGTIVMGGTVLALVLGVRLGWPPLVTAGAIGVCGAAAGLLTHLLAVRPAMGRSLSFTHTTMLSTIGLGIAANGIAALLFGADSYPVPAYVSDIPILLGPIPLRRTYLLIVGAGTVVTLALDWIVRRTSVGHVFRATLEDPEGALLLGIDTRLVIALSFATAGAMSGIAGMLIAPVISASAYTAQDLAIFGFAAMAIGGFGSFAGALLGGAIVGLVSGVIPTLADPSFVVPILWCVVVIVLLVRPGGLLGAAGLFGSSRLRDV